MQKAPGGSKATVLVVDDQQANLKLVGTLLDGAGYDVLPALSGEQALARAAAQQPDLILLDMLMPQMDGFEVCERLKKDPTLARIPVIFVTAAQDRELLVRAFHSGAVDYIVKPFVPEELLARVGTHTALKRIRDRLERIAREREDLVDLVAHDLKNPLSSMLFTSRFAQDVEVDEPQLRRLLELVGSSATEALEFIRIYLEQRASGATRTVTSSAVLLAEIVAAVVESEQPHAAARGMRLQVEPIDADACVHAEAIALRNALRNLLSNAMKYAASGGEALLSVRRGAPGFWQLCVMDRGPGIPRDKRQQLFKRFIRLAEHDPANGLSSGLGLAITKQVVEDFGGHLRYEDRLGGGASFIIELPEAHTCHPETA